MSDLFFFSFILIKFGYKLTCTVLATSQFVAYLIPKDNQSLIRASMKMAIFKHIDE